MLTSTVLSIYLCYTNKTC